MSEYSAPAPSKAIPAGQAHPGHLVRLFEASFYPVIMSVTLGAGVYLAPLFAQSVLPWHVLFVILAAAFVIAVCERILPLFLGWNVARGDVRTDLLHALFSGAGTEEFTRLLLLGLATTYGSKLSAALGFVIWPRQWPILAQLLLFLVVAEFFQYWMHRCGHQWELLWRVHAVHHSPHRLYWLNAARFHPIEIALGVILMALPPVILGAEPQVLSLVVIVTTVHGYTQHCNVRMRLGPLNYIVSSAPLHRWHHSLELEEANNNYGATLICWDLVFRTFFFPKKRAPPEKIGIADFLQFFPKGYLGQLAAPFTWNRIHDRNRSSGRATTPSVSTTNSR